MIFSTALLAKFLNGNVTVLMKQMLISATNYYLLKISSKIDAMTLQFCI